MKKIIIIDDNLPYLLNNINFKYGRGTIQNYLNSKHSPNLIVDKLNEMLKND